MPTMLNKRIGGIPAWAYVGMLVVGVGVGLYLRSRNKGNMADAAAADDTAGAQDGPNTSADGSYMSGTASGDTAFPGMGELPGAAYTGFAGGSPPAYPPAEARIDPRILAELVRIRKAEEAENRRRAKAKGKGKGKPKAPKPGSGGPRRESTVPRAHAMTGGLGGAGSPSRNIGDHFPDGTYGVIAQ